MSKDNKIITGIFMAIILAAVMLYMSSCSSVRKLKKNLKVTEQVKTSEQTTKAKDSTVSTTVNKVDSSGTSVTVVFDNEGKDTSTSVEIVTYPPGKDEYYPARTEIKTNRKPKSITVNNAGKKEQKQETKADVKTIETRAVTAEKKTVTVDKSKDIKKVRFQWWVIAIPVLVVLILWGAFGITPVTLLRKIKSFFKIK